MLGGDLNTQAQDFLLNLYAGAPKKTSSLEDKIANFEAEGDSISPGDQDKLDTAQKKLAQIVETARQTFQVDVAKACHHGSSHVTDTFLAALNPVVTVISSGDEESHAHPRPDALGTFGKHGRGRRPLIFSTELARSTREFTVSGGSAPRGFQLDGLKFQGSRLSMADWGWSLAIALRVALR